jgi:hypothetical protein
MRQLNRLLEDLKKLSASLPVAGVRHTGTPDHVRECTECGVALRRQRQYIEKLRDAAVPAASDELTARLLLRTQQLAMAPAAPAPRTGPLKLAGLAGGVAVLAAGTVVAGAYISAGEPRQYAAATFSGQAGSSAEAAASGGAAVGGGAGGGPSADPSVAALRTHGWACPDLQAMGFHIVSATSKVFAGRPGVELRLSDGRHTATVLEQHSGTAARNGAAPAASAATDVPLNPLTGHAAGKDGFVAVDAGNAAGGMLWIRASAPWSAIYQTARTTFTYVSDLPANAADDAVPALAVAGAAVSQGTGDPGIAADAGPVASPGGSDSESVLERLERGLRSMVRQVGKMTERLAQ